MICWWTTETFLRYGGTSFLSVVKCWIRNCTSRVKRYTRSHCWNMPMFFICFSFKETIESNDIQWQTSKPLLIEHVNYFFSGLPFHVSIMGDKILYFTYVSVFLLFYTSFSKDYVFKQMSLEWSPQSLSLSSLLDLYSPFPWPHKVQTLNTHCFSTSGFLFHK